MMLDLGKHAVPVLAAYGFGLLALAILIGVYVLRNQSIKSQLKRAEKDA